MLSIIIYFLSWKGSFKILVFDWNVVTHNWVIPDWFHVLQMVLQGLCWLLIMRDNCAGCKDVG